MISTYTISEPQIFRSSSLNVWAVLAPLVVSGLGALVLDWTGHQITGLLTVGWGITSVLFLKQRSKKKMAVKVLADYNLHFTPETIILGSNSYAVSGLRNLHLNVGHYDGQSTTPHKGVRMALEGMQVFTGGPPNRGDFYDGSDSLLSFFAGGTKTSVSFHIASETQRAQFEPLLKVWYAAGVNVQEFSYGLRTYLGVQLDYAQIQAFKAQFKPLPSPPQRGGGLPVWMKPI